MAVVDVVILVVVETCEFPMKYRHIPMLFGYFLFISSLQFVNNSEQFFSSSLLARSMIYEIYLRCCYTLRDFWAFTNKYTHTVSLLVLLLSLLLFAAFFEAAISFTRSDDIQSV